LNLPSWFQFFQRSFPSANIVLIPTRPQVGRHHPEGKEEEGSPFFTDCPSVREHMEWRDQKPGQGNKIQWLYREGERKTCISGQRAREERSFHFG